MKSEINVEATSAWAVGQPRQFVASDVLNRSKLYLLALAQELRIFAKPGGLDVIMHSMPHHYYMCLLQLADLSQLMAAGDLLSLTGAGFKALCCGRETRPMAAIADRSYDFIGDEPAVEAGVPPVPPVPPAPLMPPVVHAPVDVRGCHVSFDGYSHQSGRLRAFVSCQHHRRSGCEKWVFVHHHANMDAAVAWLVCWHDLAPHFEGDSAEMKEAHMVCQPSQEDVDACLRAIHGG